MNLKLAKTGEKIEGVIEKISASEIKKSADRQRFIFDWPLEKNHDVYGIREKGSKAILGLISLTDMLAESRIHINLIESSAENRGKDKNVANIPGCLIGFACQLAFEKGYGGFVSLVPKTKLIAYYHHKFGFTQIGVQMAVYMEASQAIIQKYVKDEEI